MNKVGSGQYPFHGLEQSEQGNFSAHIDESQSNITFQGTCSHDYIKGRSQSKSSRMFDSNEDNNSTSTGGSTDLTVAKEVEKDIDESVVLQNHLDAIYDKR